MQEIVFFPPARAHSRFSGLTLFIRTTTVLLFSLRSELNISIVREDRNFITVNQPTCLRCGINAVAQLREEIFSRQLACI